MKPPREQDILRACLQYLTQIRGWVAYRQNSGAMAGEYKGKRRFVRFTSLAGVSDIVAIGPDGVYIAVECKMPGNSPTAHQQAFLAAVEASGGVALVVTSVQELEAGLRKAGY